MLYERGVQQAIADYVLLSDKERKRLYIPRTPFETLAARSERFESGDIMARGLNMPPAAWSESVSQARCVCLQADVADM